MGVVSGCCCKEVYKFPHNITYPYSTCISSFLQQHPYFFVHFLDVFSFFKNKNKKDLLYFTLCICKLHYCSDVMHSLHWKSAVEHNGRVQNA